MSRDTERRPDGGSSGRLSQTVATRSTSPKDTRPRRQTQTDLVLRLLMENDAVCGSEFYRRYLPRFGARIWELRRAGYVIYRSKCVDPTHLHRNRAFAYELAALPHPPGGSDGS